MVLMSHDCTQARMKYTRDAPPWPLILDWGRQPRSSTVDIPKFSLDKSSFQPYWE
ncbi:unnamed protein product [Rhodiola kirilowii]